MADAAKVPILTHAPSFTSFTAVSLHALFTAKAQAQIPDVDVAFHLVLAERPSSAFLGKFCRSPPINTLPMAPSRTVIASFIG